MFAERPKPSHIDRLPSIQLGLSLPGQYRPPQLPGPLSGHSVGSFAGALNTLFNGMPACSAASMVNILNVEPVG